MSTSFISETAKVWLITGASTGLGFALTQQALARGDHVLATARDATRFDSFVASLDPPARARVHPLALDVDASFADIQRVVDAGVGVWGRIDCLVNNAAVGGVGPSEELGAEGMMQVMQTNFVGVMNVTNAALPHMRKERSGTIIIVGSRSAYRNEFMGIASYAASKAAVHAYGETLSAELRPFNIRVLIVVPGTFDTAINAPPAIINHPQADYAESHKGIAAMLKGLKEMPAKGDPLKGMGVIVDVVRGEARAGEVLRVQGGELPLWLFLGEDGMRDVKARLERMGNTLEVWKEVGSGLR